MTVTAWNNISYYGKRLKSDFKHLDTLIKKALLKQTFDMLEMDTLLKMMKHKSTIAYTVTKMIDVLDTNKRMQDIEMLIEAIPAEALTIAKLRIEK